MGGNFQTKDGKASINTPEAVKAMDYYAGMLRRFAPPGVVNFNWYECSSAFMQGQVAMYFDGVNFASQFEDKEKSKIAGKVGYAVLPAGPGGHFSPIFGNAVAVSSQSKVPGPAYFFAQWATSKQSAVKELLAGTGSARTSVWNDPEVKAKAKMPADWYAGLRGQPEDRPAGPARDRGRHRVPGHHRRGHPEGHRGGQVGRRAGGQAQKEFQEVLDKTEK